MKTLKIILMLLVTVSCSTGPEPINYGKDACHYCKMTIVDKTHASQAVSSKGKQFKYDAIECMVNDIAKNENTDMATILVADYLRAGEMLDAKNAHFIVSPGIPSPMGGNISATVSKTEVEELMKEHGGNLFTWEGLKNRDKKAADNHKHH